MSEQKLPDQFVSWYISKFKLDPELTISKKVKELLATMKNNSPKSYRFFVAKFKEENPNTDLYCKESVPDSYDANGAPIFTLMMDPINVPVDPKEFYSVLEIKENRCCG